MRENSAVARATWPWPGASSSVSGFLKRMRVYLREMFPIGVRVPMAVLLYASFATVLARAHGWSPAWAAGLALGSWSALALMLVLRLMDELKDLDVDRRLFASRPVPSGRVREQDIRIALAIVSALFVSAHAAAGLALATALAVLAYALLMFHWFFVPDAMRPRLLLTLATHNPVIPLLLLHLATVATSARGRGLRDLDPGEVAPLVLLYWLPLFAWEIARKIKAPRDENDYVTYSRLLGPVGAVALTAAAQTVALGIAFHVGRANGFHAAWLACIGAGWAVAQAAHVRFLLRPDADSARLRPFAELFFVAVLVAGLLA